MRSKIAKKSFKATVIVFAWRIFFWLIHARSEKRVHFWNFEENLDVLKSLETLFLN